MQRSVSSFCITRSTRMPTMTRATERWWALVHVQCCASSSNPTSTTSRCEAVCRERHYRRSEYEQDKYGLGRCVRSSERPPARKIGALLLNVCGGSDFDWEIVQLCQGIHACLTSPQRTPCLRSTQCPGNPNPRVPCTTVGYIRMGTICAASCVCPVPISRSKLYLRHSIFLSAPSRTPTHGTRNRGPNAQG